MARPRKKIEESEVEKLASIGCTTPEMAHVLGCSEDTLERRFAGIMKRGRSHRCMSLRHKQTQLALSGNVSMLIWLGKQDLGQRDQSKIEADVKGGLTVNVVKRFVRGEDDRDPS